jgi:hypothetical protein
MAEQVQTQASSGAAAAQPAAQQPAADPMIAQLSTLTFKWQDTKAKLTAAQAAQADFTQNLEEHIVMIRERFKLQ